MCTNILYCTYCVAHIACTLGLEERVDFWHGDAPAARRIRPNITDAILEDWSLQTLSVYAPWCCTQVPQVGLVRCKGWTKPNISRLSGIIFGTKMYEVQYLREDLFLALLRRMSVIEGRG